MPILACPNCQRDSLSEAHYCQQCGHGLHPHRINAHYLWHELQHGLLHMDKGILFTVKELALRPGRMVREFLAGRRAVHFKPVGFLLVIAGAYTLLKHYALSEETSAAEAGKLIKPAYNAEVLVGRWLSSHLGWMWLVLAPLVAWAIRLPFRRVASYNFYEILTLLFYLTGEAFILLALLLPVRRLLPPAPAGHPWYFYPCLAYVLWGIWQFYEKDLPRPWPRLGRAVLGLALATTLFTAVMVILFLVAVVVGALYLGSNSH